MKAAESVRRSAMKALHVSCHSGCRVESVSVLARARTTAGSRVATAAGPLRQRVAHRRVAAPFSTRPASADRRSRRSNLPVSGTMNGPLSCGIVRRLLACRMDQFGSWKLGIGSWELGVVKLGVLRAAQLRRRHVLSIPHIEFRPHQRGRRPCEVIEGFAASSARRPSPLTVAMPRLPSSSGSRACGRRRGAAGAREAAVPPRVLAGVHVHGGDEGGPKSPLDP